MKEKIGTTVSIRRLLIAHSMKKKPVDIDNPAEDNCCLSTSPTTTQNTDRSCLTRLVSATPQVESHCREWKQLYLTLFSSYLLFPPASFFFPHCPTCKHRGMRVNSCNLPVFCTLCSEKPTGKKKTNKMMLLVAAARTVVALQTALMRLESHSTSQQMTCQIISFRISPRGKNTSSLSFNN